MASMEKPKDKSDDVGFDLHMFQRLLKILGVIFPGVLSVPSGLFFLLLCLSCLEQYLVYYMGLVPSKYYGVFGGRDFDGFVLLTLQSCGLIVAISGAKAVKDYINNVLYVTWRQLLGRGLHRLYFFGINYYTLNVLNTTIDNPDQRMTQDVDKLCFTLAGITTKVIISPFQIGYYTHQTFAVAGWLGLLAIYGMFFVGTVVNKFLMSPLVKFVVRQEKREGNFRFKHMQVRVNAESVAFHVSGSVESRKTNQALDLLIRSQQKLFNRQIWLTFFKNILDYFGSIVSYLAISMPIFSGKFDDTEDISTIVSAYSFVSMYLVYSLTSLADLTTKVVLLSGVTHRVAQLVECLLKLQSDWDISTLQASSSFTNITQKFRKSTEPHASSGDAECLVNDDDDDDVTQVFGGDYSALEYAFILNDVTIIAPGGSEPLVKNFHLEVKKGENILFMGPSSSGKSSIFRVMLGLWPSSHGTVAHDFAPGPKTVIFVPQKPMLTNGSLTEQIIYPLRLDPGNPLSDDVCRGILHLLQELHMTGLVERCGGLHNDPEWNWDDALSPGEMQRVCFARVLFHRPQFALLDESTSALSLDVENYLYQACLDLNITIVSIGHRETLLKYHDTLITLDGKGGWRKDEIRVGS
ncbi:lysosomal cobalamin transporter ABCD4-like isoform X2 [Macrobrachium nipponense]